MTPAVFLLIVSGLLLAALAVSAGVRVWRSAWVARLARAEGMQFSAVDRFELAHRVAMAIPVPGASEVHVHDVMYRRADADAEAVPVRQSWRSSPRPQAGRTQVLAGGKLLCVMTVGYTIGTLGHRRHPRRVVAAVDDGGEQLMHVQMLPGLPSEATYRDGLTHLRRALTHEADAAATPGEATARGS